MPVSPSLSHRCLWLLASLILQNQPSLAVSPPGPSPSPAATTSLLVSLVSRFLHLLPQSLHWASGMIFYESISGHAMFLLKLKGFLRAAEDPQMVLGGLFIVNIHSVQATSHFSSGKILEAEDWNTQTIGKGFEQAWIILPRNSEWKLLNAALCKVINYNAF